MVKKEPLLTVQFEGPSIGSGRIAVDLLLHFLKEFNKTIYRTGLVLGGFADSVKIGHPLKNTKEEISFDLVSFTHGSPSTVLGFDRRGQTSIPSMDKGLKILEKALDCLNDIQDSEKTIPSGCDAGVMLAWRDTGDLLEKGIDKITFNLNHRLKIKTITLTKDGYQQIQNRIRGKQTNIRTIEGRLLMADFKEHGTRCRIHPSFGEPVLCLFDESQKDEVLENILHFVRIIGEAKEDSLTGKISSIKIHDIQNIIEKEDQQIDLIPVGSPIPLDFWQSPSIEELAEMQGVQPIADISVLFGTWPGELDDGFEETIEELRNASYAGESIR